MRYRPNVLSVARATRVALAEDDVHFRRLIAAALRNDGFDVLEVSNGRDLLQRVASRMLNPNREPPLDLIISDIRMPLMTGLNLLAGLRNADWDIPVILMTAFGDESTHEEAKRLGAGAVFDKPFRIDDLRTAALCLAGR